MAYFGTRVSPVDDATKRAQEWAKLTGGTANSSGNTIGVGFKVDKDATFGTKYGGKTSAVTNPNQAMDQLRDKVNAGYVPNSGSGIVPTTQQKMDGFANASINANNTVAKGEATKLDPSGVTYTAPKSSGSGGSSGGSSSGSASSGGNNYNDKSLGDSTIDKTIAELDLGMDSFDVGGDTSSGTSGFNYEKFEVPDIVNQAWAYTQSLREQLSGGRTSYSDRIDALMNEYLNREKFSYDADTDPLFQQMLASSMNSGKLAMEDTIGTAASLTGGYGNSYATRAGNSAYNQYISEAYENLPDYYNLAMQAYEMEGNQMLNKLGVLRDADDTEYSRLMDAYNINNDYANTMYDRAYTEFWDDTNFRNEEYWNNKYFDYNEHRDNVSDSHWQAEFDRGVIESDREYYFNVDRANASDAQWQAEYDHRVNMDYMDYAIGALGQSTGVGLDSLTSAQLKELEEGFVAAHGRDPKYTYLDENGKAQAPGDVWVQNYLSLIGKTNIDSMALDQYLGGIKVLKDATPQMMGEALNAYAQGGTKGLKEYCVANGRNYNMEDVKKYVAEFGAVDNIDAKTYKKIKDTKNGGGGIDYNDSVEDLEGNKYFLSELPDNIAEELTKLKEGESFDCSIWQKVVD